MKQNDFFKKHLLQYSDLNVSDKKDLYILLFLSLYNILHREETSPAYFFQNLAEIIWTPTIRKLMWFEQILNPFKDSNYMSSTVVYLWKCINIVTYFACLSEDVLILSRILLIHL